MSDLSYMVEKLGIECVAVHQGTKMTLSKGQYTEKLVERFEDRWEVVLSFEGRSATFDFTTGLGSRKLAHGVRKENGMYQGPKGNCRTAESALKEGYLLIEPKNIKAADIIYSLMIDAQAGMETFEDYCSNFGVSEDSREALDTYLKSQKNGTKLKRLMLGSYSELENLDH